MKRVEGSYSRILRKSKERGGRTKRAFVLLYTLILLTVMLVMLSALLSYTLFIGIDYTADRGKETLNRNLESAIALMLDPEFLKENNLPHTISLFGQEGDSVIVKRSGWGLFSIISVSGITAGSRMERVCLCGDYQYSKNSLALELYNCNKPLCVSGNTYLRGNILIPCAGIKPVQVDGKFYTYDSLNFGMVTSINKKMPEFKETIVNMNPKSMQASAGDDVKYIIHNDDLLTDTVISSFMDKAVLLHSKGPLTLANCYVRGRVIILSDIMITIMNTAYVHDAIIMAKCISIESGFKGVGQFIASDSLLCGQTCTFSYPSVLALINQSQSPEPTLRIAENSNVFGTVLCYTRTPVKPNTTQMMLLKGSTLTGSLYSNCKVCIMGKIHGNVATTGFYYRTHSGLYDNYLVDAVVDNSMQREYYTGLDFRKNNKLLYIIEWLY